MRSIGRAGQRLVADELEPALLACDEAGEQAHERARVAAVDRRVGRAQPAEPDAAHAHDVVAVLDDLDAERANRRDGRLRVGGAAEAGDQRLSLAHGPDENGSVRDRLVARAPRGARREQGRVRCARGRSSLESTRRTPAGPGTIPRCGSSPASSRPARSTSGTTPGGFRQYAATQEQGDGVLLHRRPPLDHASRTTPKDLRERTLDLFAMLVATGLDPERSTDLRAEPRDRARGGELAALLGHELRRAPAA